MSSTTTVAKLIAAGQKSLLPVLFLSHGGGPAHLLDMEGFFTSIDKNSKSAKFMRNLSKTVDKYSTDAAEVMGVENGPSIEAKGPVKAILVVSAHWEESTFTIDYQPGKSTKLVYDYYGFPKESYSPHLTYPAPTDIDLANRLFNMLKDAGLAVEKKDRGFDHGVFIPLKVAYPEANIPIVQLSLKSNLNMAEHIRLGELLAPLRSEGVLIVASGQITHNLGVLNPASRSSDPRASQFMDWVDNLLKTTNGSNYEESKQTLSNSVSLAPHFRYNHPREEHFVPIAVAFGAAFYPYKVYKDQLNENSEASVSSPIVERVYHEIVLGSMGIDSYVLK